MIAKAVARYVKIGPRKARLVVDVIRGKDVDEALSMLPNISKKVSEILDDLVRSAVNNARIKFPEDEYTEDVLFINKITVDEGPALVRYRAASMGRASMIKKRSSHIYVELDVNRERYDVREAQKDKRKRGIGQIKGGDDAAKKDKKVAAKGSK